MGKSYKPFLNIGPGEFIKEELEVRNWKQEDLAGILGISLKSVNKLIKSKQAVTIETAKLLSKAFSQSPQYWMNLDSNYRLRLIKENLKEREVASRAYIYTYMPIREMIKKKWLHAFNTIKELEKEVKKFWNIRRIDFSFMNKDKKICLNFKKSDAYSQYNRYYALCWFRMAKISAEKYKAKKYYEKKIKNLADNFYNFTVNKDGVKKFLLELNNTGIKFFVLSHLQKTYIDGASFFSNSNPVLVYTARYDRLDNFWYTIAHEISHILLHLKSKDDCFIDNIDELISNKEKEADRLACKLLKIKEIRNYFKSNKNYILKEKIYNCAKELKIHPAIIVGILQHDGKLSRKTFNEIKCNVSNLIPHHYLIERRIK